MGKIKLLYQEQDRCRKQQKAAQEFEANATQRLRQREDAEWEDASREENLWICGIACGMIIGMGLWFSTFIFVGSPPPLSIGLIGALGFFISALGTPFLFIWLKQHSNIFIGLMGVIPITAPLWLAWLLSKVIGG